MTPSEIEEWIRLYEPGLRRFVRLLVGHQQVDDVVQEAIVRALVFGLEEGRTPQTWLRQIARRVVCDLERKAKAEKRGGESITYPAGDSISDLAEDAPLWSATAGVSANQATRYLDLLTFIRTQPLERRHAAYLLMFEDKTLADTARELGKTRYRTRTILKQLYEELVNAGLIEHSRQTPAVAERKTA